MSRLRDLPNAQRRALDLVREIAAEKDCKPFLVGGPVRDILLGRHAVDIDLTLEEGSSTLAGALAKRVQGRVRSFPQFLTYKVTANDFPEIDIATARKERYRAPGALPTVTAGRLKDDLLRRDFSVNAIAMSLDDERLLDPTGGERDLADGIIRVLHERSFLDDPTRIFRALRLAARLGFSLETKTEELLHAALANAALTTVSRERLWRELFLAMDERDAPRILTSLRDHGALAFLLGDSLGDLRLAEHLERIQTSAQPHEADLYVLYSGALLRDTNATIDDLEGAGFSAKRSRVVLEIANDLGAIATRLGNAVSDRERFAILGAVAGETLVALTAERPEDADSVARFREYDAFRIPLRGNELDVPPGPHVARALERAREAVFNGEVAADQVRAFAREVAVQYLGEQRADELEDA
jgi:tRNA nucleotidyltransferase (CCA-adding enzyme)